MWDLRNSNPNPDCFVLSGHNANTSGLQLPTVSVITMDHPNSQCYHRRPLYIYTCDLPTLDLSDLSAIQMFLPLANTFILPHSPLR